MVLFITLYTRRFKHLSLSMKSSESLTFEKKAVEQNFAVASVFIIIMYEVILSHYCACGEIL